MQKIKANDLPEFEGLHCYDDLDLEDESAEGEEYDRRLLRQAPWLVEGGNLSMIRSESPMFLDAIFYHLIDLVADKHPVRVPGIF